MARLTGLGSFAAVSVAALLGLRLLHVGVPLLFPETHPGPFTPADLDQAARMAGFRPLVPSYRPAVLGDRTGVTVARIPRPTIEIEWGGEHRLRIIARKGGDEPVHPDTASALADVAGALWWEEDAVLHSIVRRDDVWVHVETDLPPRDLERIVRSLRPW